MKNHFSRWILCAIFLSATSAVAQVASGTPPLGSFSSGPDVINLGNLNMHFTVPVISKPGRGTPFDYILSFDSSVWTPVSVSGTKSWQPVANWGWRAVTEAATGYVSKQRTTVQCLVEGSMPPRYFNGTLYSNYQYHDAFGVVHSFSNLSGGCPGDLDQTDSVSTDASGLTLHTSGAATVTTPAGSNIIPSIDSGIGTAANGDRNGNKITTTDGNTFVDTLGVTVLSVTGGAPNPLVMTYTTSSGTQASVTMNYSTYTVQTNFACSGVSEYGPTAVSLVSSISLPDGSSYSFQYEPTPGAPANVTGRLKTITLRTGGTLTYTYTGANNGIVCSDGSAAGLTRTTSDGTTTYARSGSGTAWTTTVTDASTPGNQTVINFQTAGLAAPFNFYETHRTIKQGASTVLLQTDTCYNSGAPNCSNTAITLPITEIKKYITLNNGQQSLTDIFIDANSGLPVNVGVYDFGASPHGALLRRTTMTYAALGNGIIGMPSIVTILDPNGNQMAKTTLGYDETAVTATSSVPQHNAVTGSRGNLTSMTKWVSASASSLITRMTYDDTGNLLTVTDPAGNQTQYSYTDNFSDGINRNSLAYLTQATQPNTGSPAVSHVTKTQYDANTGLPTTTWDLNNNQTTYTYDAMGRPLQTNLANGGQTSYSYPSATNVVQNRKLSASQTISTTTVLDGMGRMAQTQLTSDPAGTDYVDTAYDANGLVASVSNPHRSVSNPTDGVTQFTYDALGRKTLVTNQDGSSVQYTYSNNQFTVTDESSRQRKLATNVLGQLTAVWEDPAGLNYETDYTYDPMGNLLTVNQKGGSTDSAQWRTRTFAYDGLSRLTQSSTPEDGTTSFSYLTSGGAECSGDPSAACLRTDARNIVTTFTYDALNRLTQQSYSDGTPSGIYNYDQTSTWSHTLTNTNGRISQILTSPFKTGSTFSYDAVGNVVNEWHCTPSNCGTSAFSVTAQYDLGGDLTSLLYPSGRLVTYGYNTAGWLNAVQFSQWNGSAPSGGVYTYWSAANTAFYPNGSASTVSLGNGVTQTLAASNRLLATQIAVNNASMGTFASHSMTYQPSGNISSVADQLTSTLTQNFTYDSLNRLATAGESRWGLSFVYDPWGNFLQQNLTSGSAGTRVDTADTHNRLTGKTYDAAGNMLNDTVHQYVYDAEDRIASVDSGADSYTYDAVGERSAKAVSGTSTEYVYFAGKMLAARAQDGTWQDYILGSETPIARAQDCDNGLRIYGTRCSSCGSQYMNYYFSNAGGLNNYTIRSGDKLYFTQYQAAGSRGGVVLTFSDSTNSNWGVKDKEGYYLNDDQTQTSTHFRTVDLTSLAGKTITKFSANQESDTAAGAFAIIYEQVAMVSSDGTVRPIYTGQTTSPVSSMSGTSGITGAGSRIDTNSGHAIYPSQTTAYFHTDHIGSSRMVTGGYGYPLWQATYLPYGQEYNSQLKVDDFKFAELRHDDESGLDHAWFRQYSATLGRWGTPDPYLGSMDVTVPQSLNLYAYLLGSPLMAADPLGLFAPGPPCPNGGKAVYDANGHLAFCDIPITAGGGGAAPGPDPGPPEAKKPPAARNKKRELKQKIVWYFCGDSPDGAIENWMETGATKGAIGGGISGFGIGGLTTFGFGGIPGAAVGAFVGGTVGAASGLLGGAAAAGVCSLAGVYH